MSKTSRNDACPCGSGRKYKRCCAAQDAQRTDLQNRYRAAVTHQHAGRLAEAESLLREIIAQQPQLAQIHYTLADVLRLAGQNAQAINAYRTTIALQPGHASAHNDLGAMLLLTGDLAEAEACFRQAIALNPHYVGAHNNLGGCLLKQGDRVGAIVAFEQVLKLEPDHAGARHLHDSLAGVTRDRPPANYVEKLFDGYAEKFDQHLKGTLQYSMPARLYQLLATQTTPPQAAWRLLDLGCGTGLVGVEFSRNTSELVGVDLSSAMLAKAAARGLYTRLLKGDLLTVLINEPPQSFEVVVAADVFVYLGRLDEVLADCCRLLSLSGYLAFSVESLDVPQSGDDAAIHYQLNTTGRYAHSWPYLEKLATDIGFQVLIKTQIPVRVENSKPILAWATVWQRRR